MSEITYVYRTDNSNYEEIFKNGIVFYNSDYDLSESFEKVYDLYDYLGNVNDDEAVYIIKIPETYMEVKMFGSKRILPYPILFEKETLNKKGKTCDIYPVLVPSLIQMMYQGNYGCVENPNYNPGFNPCGLKYTSAQLKSIKDKVPAIYDIFKKRNTSDDCKYLYNKDLASGLWNETLAYNHVSEVVPPFASKGEIGRINYNKQEKKDKTKRFKPNKKHRREE